MPLLHTLDPIALEDLKRQAIARAERLGHRLQPFRAAKHDPLCHVSFCGECRQMVIVSLEGVAERAGTLYGYALEARCATPLSVVEEASVAAGTR